MGTRSVSDKRGLKRSNDRRTDRGPVKAGSNRILNAISVLDSAKQHTRLERRAAKRQLLAASKWIRKHVAPAERTEAHKLALKVGAILTLAR